MSQYLELLGYHDFYFYDYRRLNYHRQRSVNVSQAVRQSAVCAERTVLSVMTCVDVGNVITEKYSPPPQAIM